MAGTRSRRLALSSKARNLAALCCLFTGLIAEAAFGQPLERYTFVRPQMGTQVRIVLYAADSTRAAKAAAMAFDRIESLNGLLSDWLIDSELSLLSGTYNEQVAVSRDLWNVLSEAQRIAKRSHGHFDVTVGPLTRLWRWSARRNQLPPEDALANAKTAVGYQYLVLDSTEQSVRLTRPDMRLDLGGIAKGFAADEALSVLLNLGFSASMVDAGGDIALGAAPPQTDGWPIKVLAVDSSGHRVNTAVHLSACGVAASGSTYRYLEYEGTRYSHIVNPKTGMGVTFERIVTVVASSAMRADAWASAYSVMDADEALQHSKALFQVDLFMVDRLGDRNVTYFSRDLRLE